MKLTLTLALSMTVLSINAHAALRCEDIYSLNKSDHPVALAPVKIDFTSPYIQAQYHKIFSDAVGETFLSGEQELQDSVPITSHPGLVAGRINPKWGLLSAIPLEYQPKSARIFPLYVFNVDASQAAVHRAASHKNNDEEIIRGPNNTVRIFIHPLDLEFAKKVFQQEPEEWPATATSSLRTVLAQDPHTKKVFMVKVSLHAKEGALGGVVAKINTPTGLEKATVLTDVLQNIHDQTGGILTKSQKSWDFMPESSSARATGESGKSIGGYIVRDTSMLKKEKNESIITWYALFSKQPDGRKSIIDQLYADSTYRSKSQFAWKELVEPLLELESLLKWKYQLSTQFHQQNTMVKMVSENGRIRITGLLFRDIEGMSVGNTVRTRFFGEAPVRLTSELKDFKGNAKLFGFARTSSDLFFSYRMKLRQESIVWAFTSWLNPIGARLLAAKADRSFLESFNQAFPKAMAPNLAGAEKYLTALERSLENSNEVEFFEKLRSESPIQKLFNDLKRNKDKSIKNRDHFTAEDIEPDTV